MESIPATAKASLEDYVKKGGGLVWIAGEHNVYVDKKGKPEDALERSLPAKLAPPRSPEGTAVVLDHRQIVVHGRPQDRTGAHGGHRRGGKSAPNRFGGRADLRQFLPVGGAHPQGGGSRHHQEADLRHHARWRHPDRPGAHRGVSAHSAADGDVQTRRAADRRYFRGRRQHDAHQGSTGQSRDHLHGRAGAGCEPRVSREGGVERGRQIVLPQRPLRPGTDPVARRGRTHRRDGGGEGDHSQSHQAGGDSGWRGDGERSAVERLRALFSRGPLQTRS